MNMGHETSPIPGPDSGLFHCEHISEFFIYSFDLGQNQDLLPSPCLDSAP